jgi:hypothetical protein
MGTVPTLLIGVPEIIDFDCVPVINKTLHAGCKSTEGNRRTTKRPRWKTGSGRNEQKRQIDTRRKA